MKLNRDIVRQLVNLTAIVAAFGINVLANIAPINGVTIGEISNTIFADVLITPANYAFAIWGLIYLGLISFAVYQALPAQRQNPRLRQMGYLLAIASLAQIFWVLLFQLRLFSLSLVAMLMILLPLMLVYRPLEIGYKQVSRQQRWLVNIPVSVYFAWISVATIVNVAIALYHLDWSGWGISPVLWTVIMMVVGTAIAATIILRRSDIAYGGVFVWALVAIALRHLDTFIIASTAGGLAIGLLLLIVLTFL